MKMKQEELQNRAAEGSRDKRPELTDTIYRLRMKTGSRKENDMAALHVTKDNFDSEVLQADKPVLIDFWADWCGPCQMVGPLVEQLSEEMDSVKFVKVNVSEQPELAGRYGVESIPTFLLLKKGTIVKTEVGALPKQTLKSMIEENI